MGDKEYDEWVGKADPDTARRFTWGPGDIKIARVPGKDAKAGAAPERDDLNGRQFATVDS